MTTNILNKSTCSLVGILAAKLGWHEHVCFEIAVTDLLYYYFFKGYLSQKYYLWRGPSLEERWSPKGK